ncbi:hypothetical protein ABW21_db0207417 [Orbilia brochopaga]|nr:hypothetical protein ABW21_db0207417 [Drechslerella brochopaga]
MAARLSSIPIRPSLLEFHPPVSLGLRSRYPIAIPRRHFSSTPAGHEVLATLITKDATSGAVCTRHTTVSRATSGCSISIADEVGDIFKVAAAAKGTATSTTSTTASTSTSGGSSGFGSRFGGAFAGWGTDESLEIEDGEIEMVYDCSTGSFGLGTSNFTGI